MTPDCVLKMKPLVSDEDFAILEAAQKADDNFAWDEAVMKIHDGLVETKRRAIINAGIKLKNTRQINKMMDKGYSLKRSAMNFLSGSAQDAGHVPVEMRIKAVRETYMGELHRFLHETRSTMLGLRRASNPDYVKNIVKGIFGDQGIKIPKGGQGLIDAWNKVAKKMFIRRNVAGMDVKELADYFLPVNHSQVKIIKLGEDAWVADAKRNFTIRRPDVPKHGKVLTDDELLKKIYKSITMEGRATRMEGATTSGKPSFATAHQDFRYLQPKSGKDWLEYTAKYGRHSNPVDAIKEFVSQTSHEIGLLETMGTQPRKMAEDMAKDMQRMEGGKAVAGSFLRTFDRIMPPPAFANPNILNTFRAVRSFEAVTKLPGVTVSALSDSAFMAAQSLMNGVPIYKPLIRHLKNLATHGDYTLANRLALASDYAMGHMVGSLRYNDSMGFSAIDRVTDFALRAYGLNHWTNSAKAAFSLELLGHMTTLSEKGFAKLPKKTKNLFRRYGVDQAEWDMMRGATTTIKGAKWIDPLSDKMDDALRTKLIGLIKEETRKAVPEPSARTSSIVDLGSTPNTITNELIKTPMQFNSFPITVMHQQMAQMMDHAVPMADRFGYLTFTALGTTVLGTIAHQIKQIAAGRTPEKMSPELIGKGFLQGGISGKVGDFLLTDPTAFGGLEGKIAGPAFGDISDVMKAMYKVGQGKTPIGKAALDTAEAVVPIGRMPFVRVAVERAFLDQARRATDPDYYSRIARTQKWLGEQGQEYWSKPK